MGRLERSGFHDVLVKLPCISLGSGKARLSFELSSLFPGFSGACACALPLSNLFFPKFPQASSLSLLFKICFIFY